MAVRILVVAAALVALIVGFALPAGHRAVAGDQAVSQIPTVDLG